MRKSTYNGNILLYTIHITFVFVAFPAEDAVIGVLPVVRIFLDPMPLEFPVDGGVAPTKIPSHFLRRNAGKKKILNLAATLFREMRHCSPPEKFVRLNALPPPGRGSHLFLLCRILIHHPVW